MWGTTKMKKPLGRFLMAWGMALQLATFAGCSDRSHRFSILSRPGSVTTAAKGCPVHAASSTSEASGGSTFSISLKLFIQGYILQEDSTLMASSLKNQLAGSDSTVADEIVVELHDAKAPHNTLHCVTADLKTDGSLTARLPAIFSGKPYFIAIKHRSALETWSATAPELKDGYHYDFSSAAGKAYGSNQIQVAENQFAFYSGDIDQDGMIALGDSEVIEDEASNFKSGKFTSDLNGDGNVDILDISVHEKAMGEAKPAQYPH